MEEKHILFSITYMLKMIKGVGLVIIRSGVRYISEKQKILFLNNCGTGKLFWKVAETGKTKKDNENSIFLRKAEKGQLPLINSQHFHFMINFHYQYTKFSLPPQWLFFSCFLIYLFCIFFQKVLWPSCHIVSLHIWNNHSAILTRIPVDIPMHFFSLLISFLTRVIFNRTLLVIWNYPNREIWY